MEDAVLMSEVGEEDPKRDCPSVPGIWEDWTERAQAVQ